MCNLQHVTSCLRTQLHLRLSYLPLRQISPLLSCTKYLSCVVMHIRIVQKYTWRLCNSSIRYKLKNIFRAKYTWQRLLAYDTNHFIVQKLKLTVLDQKYWGCYNDLPKLYYDFRYIFNVIYFNEHQKYQMN